MLLSIGKRLLSVLGTMLLVSIVAFSFIHLIPGDPARLLAGEKAPLETVAKVTEKLGLDQPLPVQYIKWVSGIFQGDFGTSFRTGKPVMDEIKLRYWNTFRMAVISLVWSTIVGLLIGVWSGTHAGKWQDYVGVTTAVAGQAVPEFWVGLMLIFVSLFYFGCLARSYSCTFYPFCHVGNFEGRLHPYRTCERSCGKQSCLETRFS